MQIDPVAFRILTFPVYWYGIMIASGLLLGFLVTLRLAQRYAVNKDKLVAFLLAAVPAALAGARLGYVAAHWPQFAGDWRAMAALRQGGLSIHGGLAGAVFAALVWTRLTRHSFWRLADLCSPGLALGQAVGRFGNFFNQEAFGVETRLPWAVYMGGAWRHPTFFYESAWNLVVFAFLLWLGRREKTEGGVFLRYLIWYSAGRYFIEGLRAESAMWGGFRIAQILSLVLIHGALVVLWLRKRQARAMGVLSL